MTAPIKEVQTQHNPIDAGQHQAREIATAAGDKMRYEAYDTPKNSFSLGMLAGVNRTFGASSEGTRVAKEEPSSLEVPPISTVLAAQNSSGDQPNVKARQAADESFNAMVA
jgi:hypothetical protein